MDRYIVLINGYLVRNNNRNGLRDLYDFATMTCAFLYLSTGVLWDWEYRRWDLTVIFEKRELHNAPL